MASAGIGVTEPDIEDLLAPMSARSLVASALLGSHPPALPGRMLVAMAERFAINGGTTRVALSRMVERGELTNDEGVYTLAGPLLERQERQDRSRRRADPDPWDGTWEQAIVTATGRTSSERTKVRKALGSLGLGERREGVWMRPANLDSDRLPFARAVADEQVAWYRVAPLQGDVAQDLAHRLFDVDGWATTARALQAAIHTAQTELHGHDDAVVAGFNLASATLRHLVHDPQLPPALAPCCWPAEALRQAYEDYEHAYQQLLRRFLRSVP